MIRPAKTVRCLQIDIKKEKVLSLSNYLITLAKWNTRCCAFYLVYIFFSSLIRSAKASSQVPPSRYELLILPFSLLTVLQHFKIVTEAVIFRDVSRWPSPFVTHFLSSPVTRCTLYIRRNVCMRADKGNGALFLS